MYNEAAVETLRKLKAPALHCLVALAITPLSPVAVDAKWIRFATGYSQDAVSDGLGGLRAMGLAEQVTRYSWQLTNKARELPLPLRLLPQVTSTQAAAEAPLAASAPFGPDGMTADTAAVETLRKLKGAALNCLVALASAQADIVDAKWIRSAAGYSQDAVSDGLGGLRAMGLAREVGRYGWQLTSKAAQLPLPLNFPPGATPEKAESGHFLANSTPEKTELIMSASAATPEKAESPAKGNGRFEREFSDSEKSGVTAPESESLKNDSDSEDTKISQSVSPFWQEWLGRVQKSQARHLQEKYLTTLTAGKVFPQLRAKLARELAAEGPGYLLHLLGHIAYSRSDACEHSQPGAVVYPAVRERDPAPPEFLPPQSLDFEQALAWALRGGRREEAAEPESDDAAAGGQLEELLPPREPTPEERVWQAALGQLQLEMSKGTFDTWVRDTVPLGFEADTYVVGVGSVHARDWLENRLLKTVKRTLAGVIGRPVEVRFAVCNVRPSRPGDNHR